MTRVEQVIRYWRAKLGAKGWLVDLEPTRERVAAHVRPENDRIEHVLSGDCECGPREDPIADDDGTYGVLYVHHSLDGREANE